MTVVYEKHTNTPGTHALVIGVGRYRHMLGGSNPNKIFHSLGQLSSPPLSAKAMALWLLNEFNNSDKPLASLAILLSDSTGELFIMPDGSVQTVSIAHIANIKEAVIQWKKRANSHKENATIFYYCGHGLANGLFTYLVAEDFGKNPDGNPNEELINISGLVQGMESCKARYQCYLVDACRTTSRELTDTMGPIGTPILPAHRRDLNAYGLRDSPIIYSTALGQQAFGKEGKISFFTDYLLKALEGPASRSDSDGCWHINPLTIACTINQLHKLFMEETGPEQYCRTEGSSMGYNLHSPKTIKIPVQLGCSPKEANAYAQMSVAKTSNNTTIHVGERSSSDYWSIILDKDMYRFCATFPQHNVKYQDKELCDYIVPPCRRISLEVLP